MNINSSHPIDISDRLVSSDDSLSQVISTFLDFADQMGDLHAFLGRPELLKKIHLIKDIIASESKNENREDFWRNLARLNSVIFDINSDLNNENTVNEVLLALDLFTLNYPVLRNRQNPDQSGNIYELRRLVENNFDIALQA